MCIKKNTFLRAFAALGLLAGATLAQAEDQAPNDPGRFRAGIGFTLVEPANENGNLLGQGRIEAGSSKRPTFVFSYHWRPRVALEVMLGYPFKHSLARTGTGSLATVRQFPAAVTAQYHFTNSSRFTPFVGLGVGYIKPFDVFPRNVLRERDLSFESDFGVTVQAGIDYRVTDRHGIRLDARYFNTSFDTTLDGQRIGTLSFNPVFYSLSYIYTF
ncbi:MAG: OmpW family outer membrane protein [Pseudomonadota bacterium]